MEQGDNVLASGLKGIVQVKNQPTNGQNVKDSFSVLFLFSTFGLYMGIVSSIEQKLSSPDDLNFFSIADWK